MKQLVLALSLTTALTAAGISQAQAGPAVAAVAAFAANPIGGAVLDFAAGLALEGVGTLIHNLTDPPQKTKGTANVAGVRGSVSVGGDGPISFVMGDRATAGTLVYRGSWGKEGATPNAYYVEERVFSDVPLSVTGLLIEKQHYTVDWDVVPAAQGYPITELTTGGKAYGWFRWADGTQTTADAYLLATFGADPDHPYTNTMIGRGQAKGVLTLRLNAKLFPGGGFPDWSIATDGIALYNVAKDSTAGGSGDHRRDDPSTWEPSNLLPVHIYNAIMGVYWGGEWIWGGQNVEAVRLPASSWIAAIAEADTDVDKADDTTEKQFVGGFEITGDMEPASFIERCLDGCSGRIAEIGGIYKMLCGLPASPVFSFTDDDIVVTREQGFDPFPKIDSGIFNTIFAKYYEPSQGWTTKDIPPIFNAELEAADDGQRLAANVTYEVVNSGTQGQRLNQAALLEGRRWVTHMFGLGPEASELEPLDMVAWTSERLGYSSKKFIIGEMADDESFEQFVTIKEVDPADLGYSAATDEQAMTFPTLDRAGPAPVQVAGYQAFGDSFLDDDGVARRPTIRLRFPGGLDDVEALHVTVRLASSGAIVFDANVPYDAPDDGTTYELKLNGVFIGDTAYQVQFDERPFSARDTIASAWIDVTTPVVPDAVVTGITNGQLNQQLQDAIAFVLGVGDGTMTGLVDRILNELDRVAGGVTENTMASDRDRKAISSVVGQVQAAVVQEATTRADADTALSQFVLEVAAQAASGLAEGLFTVRAESAPAGVSVRLALLARVTTLDDYVETGILIDLESDGGGGYVSKILFKADSIYFTDGDVATIPMVFEDGVLKLNVGNIGTVNAGLIQSTNGLSYWNLGTGAFRIST